MRAVIFVCLLFSFVYALDSKSSPLVHSKISSKINVNLNIKNISNPLIVEVSSLENDLIETPMLDLKVGEVGIVQRNLSDYKAIVASVEIIRVDQNKAYAKVLPFKDLSQKYLPKINLKPQKGDKIFFRSFNNKALLISPNIQSYDLVKKEFNYVDFVSPDLLLGYLNLKGKFDPSPKLISDTCMEYSIGLVFIIGSKNMGVYQCSNFTQLYKIPLENIPGDFKKDNFSSPFYSRVELSGGGSLTYLFSSKKSRKDYFAFYDSILNDFAISKDEKTNKNAQNLSY